MGVACVKRAGAGGGRGLTAVQRAWEGKGRVMEGRRGLESRQRPGHSAVEGQLRSSFRDFCKRQWQAFEGF